MLALGFGVFLLRDLSFRRSWSAIYLHGLVSSFWY